jgi:hypothetical protein
MGLVIWRKSRVPLIAEMGISGIDSTCGINSTAHSKNGPGIDSTHGIDRPLMETVSVMFKIIYVLSWVCLSWDDRRINLEDRRMS